MAKRFTYLEPVTGRPGVFEYSEDVLKDARMTMAERRGRFLMNVNGFREAAAQLEINSKDEVLDSD